MPKLDRDENVGSRRSATQPRGADFPTKAPAVAPMAEGSSSLIPHEAAKGSSPPGESEPRNQQRGRMRQCARNL